ncbi:putative RNA recognition motif domain, nucleotide-binding alpha-beta plait domain superfamily [Helianthus annuus]|nr:putative RNA recognition motif domain, nucleotide-binding alpha-beta plait domain superfamily [Helianthus annuus]
MAGSSGGHPVVRKFFVSNIPQGCRPWDLADAFRRFGEVSGAFIAKKKDKEGRTFGFVSFKGVRNVEDLGRELKKMNLGGNKLIVNLARYANENADAFPTREKVSAEGVVVGLWGVFRIVISRRRKQESGFLDNSDVWKAWFSKVEVWKGQSMPFECLAWINIFGVPPHLLSSTVFDVIGQKYGRIAQGSQLSESDDDLTYDRIGILTDSGNKISGIVNLRRQDKVYRVWVVEESDPWIPDFLNKDGYVGEDVSLSSEFSVPAHLSPVIGEKLNGVVEVMASGSEKSNLAVGAAQQSVDVNEETIPREQENVGCQENYGCFNFAAHSAGGLDVNNGGPTLVDHWANLVGKHPPDLERDQETMIQAL